MRTSTHQGRPAWMRVGAITAGALALAAVGATTASAANIGTITVGADGSYSPATLTGAVDDTFTINATATGVNKIHRRGERHR